MARDHAILKREIAQPRRAPSLPDLLTYLMDQHGLSRADLVPPLGTPSRGPSSSSSVLTTDSTKTASKSSRFASSCVPLFR